MNCNLIIKGKYVLTMNEKMDVFNDGIVAIDDDKIITIGTKEILKKYKSKKIIDAGNSIVMPGLINTHTHAAMAYFRGLADDLPLKEWLEKHIWPAEAKYVNKNFVKKASALACLEMIKSGITCFNDMYFFEEEIVSIVSQSGMRACVGEAILDFPTASCKNPEDALKKTEEMILKYKDSELISVAIAPHSIYACSKENLIKAKELAGKYSVNLHMHISETKKENEDCLRDNKKSPVKYLDELGVLDNKTIAAHSIWLDNADIEIYKNRQVKISHCPISNMKLASGVMNFKKMNASGLVISLGTDGAASNNTLDLFSEMRVCALLHKVNNLNSEIAPAVEIVKAATINGAKALGMDNKIGSLAIGKKADIITINLDKSHLSPIYNPYSHLVYAVNAGDVENVIINGKIVMRDREILGVNENEILREVDDFINRGRTSTIFSKS